jgi:AP-3 complex subunit delta-1
MFEKTLGDIVKGIRASKRDTGLYISACIAEIKTELNSTDLYVKANALQKLTFLQMMGYSMSWASFATIEVMSSQRFAHKRIGYLAASQGFTQNTEVILLTTNLLKKELRGSAGNNMQGVYEAGLAINCISNIVTEDLARDLLPELVNLTRHPQPYVRKKATLCLFKLFVKYPQSLRLAFPNIQQALDDSNPSVVSCAVNVITELSDKNPTNYLHLAPAFFSLLTNSTNNWMLIKVVKLLGSLVPEEPRLARKLLEPLALIVRSTQAKSLLFEAVHTLTLSLPYCRKSDGSMPASVPDVVTLCAATLRSFVEEPDQNLKYLGLVGFGSLMASYPKVISAPEYRPLILKCLSDDDVTIRTRALDLLKGMASRKNLQELISQLLTHVELASGSYKNDLVLKIMEMCSGDKYALVQDFGWYLNVLWALAHMRGIAHAEFLQSQVTDVALRVLPVRAYAVQQSMKVLTEKQESNDEDKDNGRGKQVMKEVLPAFAWIVGEYSDLIQNAEGEYTYEQSSKGNYHSLVQVLVSPSNIRELPTTTQSVYVQAAMKVFAAATTDTKVSNQELEACVETLMRCLPVYMESTDTEVQERSFTAIELLFSLKLSSSIVDVPGLATADSDDGSEDDNLLGMMQSSTKSKQSFVPSSLSARCRGVSDTLKYILKPEPMKPTGAKAQRKKRQAPMGVDLQVLDSPVDLSIFSSFIEDELSQRPDGANISLESVIFTQQRPLRLSSTETRSGMPMDMNTMHVEMPTSTSSFQHMGEVAEGSGFGAHQQLNRQQQDPFYLDSGAPSEAEGNHQSRFGTIQLTDSDGHESGGRKRKKKKKKRSNKERASIALGDADFSMLGIAESPLMPQPASTGLTNVTIYTSDDDDDEEDQPKRKSAASKEFEGLAKVDLTTPLREDEVIPERQHHVVLDRKPDRSSKRNPPKKQKKKDEKKLKKKNKWAGQEPSGGGNSSVGDLLDLSGFMPVADVSNEVVAASPKEPNSSTKHGNSINTAFDDLLSLSAPELTALQPAAKLSPAGSDIFGKNAADTTQNFANAASKNQRVWMNATIKASRAEGSPVVDWTRTKLHYQVHSKKDGTVAVTYRVENHMDNSTLHNVTLKLKGQSDIVFGNVAPQQSIESQKSGPFSYGQSEVAVELKGSLVTPEPECTVPVRISLPVAHFLSPLAGLSQENVMNELSSTQWSSHSVKLSGLKNPTKAKAMLCSFLHAAEVEGASSPLMGTIASQSREGSKVFCLVKIKDSTAKIDLKCSSETLCKSLTSDVKKLVI